MISGKVKTTESGSILTQPAQNKIPEAQQTSSVGNLIEELIGTWHDKKQVEVEEFFSRFERPEETGKVKPESVSHTFRSEANSFRLGGQRTEHTQNGRPVWPANQAEIFEKIGTAARLARSGGTSEISLRLEPEHLGFMKIRLSVDHNQVLTAKIQVETHEARSLIESSLKFLKDSLTEQGLKVEKFSVDVRQDQNQEHSQMYSGNGSHSRNHPNSGLFPEGEGYFSDKRTDYEPVQKTTRSPVKKYSYSTLEWVA
ncbi:MAG: hypothetical protein DRP79_09180 [Planctomycetota bacterium]|nr:MAG: hypothetical protein DRP79_09180 [Planctomycetota bacterium]